MPVRDLRWPLAAVFALAGFWSAAAADRVFPPGSRFGFEPPSDMVLSKRFSGFEREEGGATVSVVELPPNAFPELVAGFTDANLRNQGFAIATKEPMRNDSGIDHKSTIGPAAAFFFRKSAAKHTRQGRIM